MLQDQEYKALEVQLTPRDLYSYAIQIDALYARAFRDWP